MKHIIFTFCALFLVSIVFSQTVDFQAQSNGDDQIVLRSNDNNQIYKLRMNNDGDLRIIANTNDPVMIIDDNSRDISIYGEINTSPGTSNMIARGYGSYTDIAGSGMHNQSSNIVSMTKITTGTHRVRIKFNGNYAASLAITATPIQNDISSGYFCTIIYVDADEIDVVCHALGGSAAGDQSFSFMAFAQD